MNIEAICKALPRELKPAAVNSDRFTVQVEGECMCNAELSYEFKRYSLTIVCTVDMLLTGPLWRGPTHVIHATAKHGKHPHINHLGEICIDSRVTATRYVNTELDCVRYVMALVAALPYVRVAHSFYADEELFGYYYGTR